jgi:prophage regulatory protein
MAMQSQSIPQTGFLRVPQVLQFVPFGRSTLWLKVKQGEFPAPRKLSDRVSAWRAEDVRAWIETKGAQSGK